MTKMTSNKPYLIRAIYEWIVDNELTPYILVDAQYPTVQVPEEYVNGGQIILNISPKACRGLHIENDRIVFTARFSGQSVQIYLVPGAVLKVYAKENGEGFVFGPEYDNDPLPPKSTEPKRKSKPALTLVKKED
ncbi:MAG: ClpXP protease specificity-enhancing factor [Tatlockia sp.]|jgi:stringent starvation protein B